MGSSAVMVMAAVSLVVAATVCSASSGSRLECEDIPTDLCAFAVSSSGARCVLEKVIVQRGDAVYECQASPVLVAPPFVEWIETDQCIASCGLERMSVGMSSDTLVEPKVVTALCSHPCQQNCPNLIDLYTNLAAGEGANLPQLCKEHHNRRMMLGGQLLSVAVSTSSSASPPMVSLASSFDATPPAQSPVIA